MLGTWVLVAAVVLAGLWWLSRRYHHHWADLGVPSEQGIPFFGSSLDLLIKRKAMWEIHQETYNRHRGSKYYGYYEMSKPTLMISDPDILKHVLVKDFDHFVNRRTFGEDKDSFTFEMLSMKSDKEWKVLRSIMSPTFSSGKMRRMYPLVCSIANTLVTSCLKDGLTNPALDMKNKYGRFTMDTIASCAFGIECHSLTEEKPIFAQKAEQFFTMSAFAMLKMFMMLLLPIRISQFLGLSFDSPATYFFKEVTENTISERLAGQKRGDFLDLMLETREDKVKEEGEEDERKDEEGATKTITSAKKVLTDRTIVAQCILFLVAGYDTTASTLAFASHLLAQHPAEQQRLRQELQELMERDGELTYQGIMEAKFLDACINETLRLYPPAVVGERKCTKSYRLPESGVPIQEGDMVVFSIWSLHHDDRYWPNPLRFIPDRFMPENKANIIPFTHLPFGMGPRNCLAMRFAQMEVKVALAKMILAADLQVAPGHEEIVLDTKTFFVRPADGSQLLVKPLGKE